MPNPFDIAESELTGAKAANPFDVAETELSSPAGQASKLTSPYYSLKRGVVSALGIPDVMQAAGTAGISKPTVAQSRRAFVSAMSDPQYQEQLIQSSGDRDKLLRVESMRGPEAKLEAMKLPARVLERANVEEVAKTQGRLAEYPTSPAQERLAKAGTSGEKWGAWLKDPVELTASIVLESLPPSMAGAVVGSVGGPGGVAAGVGASSGAMTFASEFLNAAASDNVDLKDPQSLQEFLDDEARFRPAFSKAMTKAVIVGGVDAATAGTAGRWIEPALKQGLKQRAVATGKEVLLQAAGGAGGEAAAEVATGQKLDPFDIAMEALAEVATTPGEVLSNLRHKSAATEAPPPAAEQPKIAESQRATEPPVTPPQIPESNPFDVAEAGANPFDIAEGRADPIEELVNTLGQNVTPVREVRVDDETGKPIEPVKQYTVGEALKDLPSVIQDLRAAIAGNQLSKPSSPSEAKPTAASIADTGLVNAVPTASTKTTPAASAPPAAGGSVVELLKQEGLSDATAQRLAAGEITADQAVDETLPTIVQPGPNQGHDEAYTEARDQGLERLQKIIAKPTAKPSRFADVPAATQEPDDTALDYGAGAGGSVVPAVERWQPTPGKQVIVQLTGRGKGRLAKVIQVQPDGSAMVKLDGEKVYRTVNANQMRPTGQEAARRAKAEEVAQLPPAAQGDANEFAALVEEFATHPDLGWVEPEAYGEADVKGQGIEFGRLRQAAREKAARVVGIADYQDNSVADRARALPALEAFLQRQFPDDKTVANRRALRKFKADDPQSQTTASPERIASDQRLVEYIQAANPATPEFRGIRAVGAKAAPHRLEGQPGGNRRQPRAPSAAQRQIAEQLSRLFGVRIIFVEMADGSPVQFNGVYNKATKTILIAADAQVPSLTVSGHELLHHIEQVNPEIYRDLKEALLPFLRNSEKYAARMRRQGYENFTADDVTNEMLGDFMGDSLSDPKFLQDLARREPTLFKKFARVAMQWLDKLIAKAKHLAGYGSAEYITDLEHARTILAITLRKAALETQVQKGRDRKIEGHGNGASQMSRKEGVFQDAIGSVDPFGEVRGKVGDGDYLSHNNDNVEGANAWRYDKKSQTVGWWGSIPDPKTQDMVVDWLARRGLKTARHKRVGYNAGNHYSYFSRKDANAEFSFDAPESVADQKARQQREARERAEAERLADQKAFVARGGDRLTGQDLDTTKEMFGSEVKVDKAGQGSLFSRNDVPDEVKLFKPVTGPTGFKIVGYEWRSTMGEKWSNREGGYVEGRVSDWDNADESTGTGRSIVHVYWVESPDGKVKPEGIRSAQNVLGISETNLQKIAKRERAAQQYHAEQDKAENANLETAAVATPQEAARKYRTDNHSAMRSFEENNDFFRESALFEKSGKFIRRNWKAAQRMLRFGWNLVQPDPANTTGTSQAAQAINDARAVSNTTNSPTTAEGLQQGSLFSRKEARSELESATREWAAAEKRYRRARRQDPSDVEDAAESREEAEINFRALADQAGLSQSEFDELVSRAKALDTDNMPDAGSLFSRKEGNETPGNLVALHNTTVDKLRHMLKMGGLAVPSVAIARTDKGAFESFGDISLVGNPDLVTPGKDTKVLNADAYSPRYPTVNYFLAPASQTKLGDYVASRLRQLPADMQKEFSRYTVNGNVEEKGVRDAMQNDAAVGVAFLADTGRLQGFKWTPVSEDNQRYSQGVWHSDVRDFTRKKYGDGVDNSVHDEFLLWIEDRVKGLGLQETEKIFNGFTNSGNRRYLTHDLDTVVRIMKKGFRDAEGFNYGVGSVRSTAARQFRTLKAIQSARGDITTKTAMDKLKDEADKEFTNLADYALEYRRGGTNSGFGALDAFCDDLKAMAAGGTENYRHLREVYPGAEPFAKMREFLDKLRTMPTEYFEAKIKRAVQLQEFSGAAVPDTTPADLIQALEKRGLGVKTYPKGNSEARRAAVESIGQERGVLFSRKETEELQRKITEAEEALREAIAQHMRPTLPMTKAQARDIKTQASARLRNLRHDLLTSPDYAEQMVMQEREVHRQIKVMLDPVGIPVTPDSLEGREDRIRAALSPTEVERLLNLMMEWERVRGEIQSMPKRLISSTVARLYPKKHDGGPAVLDVPSEWLTAQIGPASPVQDAEDVTSAHDRFREAVAELPATGKAIFHEAQRFAGQMVAKARTIENRDIVNATKDAADNKGQLLGRQAANVLLHELNRAFGVPLDTRNLLRENALTFAVEAQNLESLGLMRDTIETSQHARSRWAKTAIDAINYAEKHWERFEQVTPLYERVSTAQVTHENTAGIKTLTRKGGYVFHLQDVLENWQHLDVTGGAGGIATPFKNVRDYATYADSIAAGLSPKSLNALDLMQRRVSLGQKLINYRAWVGQLRGLTDPATALPLAADVVVRVRADGTETQTAPIGYSLMKFAGQTYAIHKGYVGLFKALTSDSNLRMTAGWHTLMRAATTAKHMMLLFDSFHLGRLAYWNSITRGAGQGAGAILPGNPFSHQRGYNLLESTPADIQKRGEEGEFTPEQVAQLLENKATLGKLLDAGLNVGSVGDNIYNDWVRKLPLAGQFNRWLFEKYQRGAMTEVALIEFQRQRQMHQELTDAQVARMTAKAVNIRFGNLNSQAWVKSRFAQDLLRIVFLAPQWNESLIRSEIEAVKDAGKLAAGLPQGKLRVGTLGRAVATAFIGQFIANQLINYFFRGQPTWDNDEEGFESKISAWVPDFVGNSAGYFLNPMTLPTEMTHLILKGHARTGRWDESVVEAIRSRFSSFGRFAAIFYQGKNSMGERSTGLGSRLALAAEESAPLPIGAQAPSRMVASAITGESKERYPGQFQRQLMQSVGIKPDTAPSPERRISALAREFNREAGKESTLERMHSPYADLDNYLRTGNQSAARAELKTILETRTPEQVGLRYEQRTIGRFTGSTAREKAFKASLNAEQRKQYELAIAERKRIRGEVEKLLRAVR